MTFDLYFINLNSCHGNYSREETIQGRKLFAEIRYPKNQDGWTPLHAAAESGNLKTFKMIFDEVEEKNPSAGFGVVGNNWTPLH